MSGSILLAGTHIAKIFLRLLSTVVLTRLLYPEAFGYMAVVMSAVLIISLSTDIGIKPFLIRYPGAISDRMLDVIWTLKLLRGAILFFVMLVASGSFGDFYGDEKIANLLRIVAISALLSAASPLSLYWAEKNQRFSLVAGAEFAAFLAQTVVVIIFTAIYQSYWCLALGSVVNSFVLFMIASHLNGYRYPKLILNWEDIREIWTFIKWITFGSAIFVAVMQADRFVIGKVFGAEILGFYAIALTISEALTTMAQNIGNRIGFPTWADARRNGDVKKSFTNFSKIFIPIAGLASGSLVFVADNIVAILYDQRYQVAGVLLAILCLRTVLVGLLTTTVDLLVVDGKSRAMFTANVIRLIWVFSAVTLATGTNDVRIYAFIFTAMDVPSILFYAVVARGYRTLFALNIVYALAGLLVGVTLSYFASYMLTWLMNVF